MTMQMRLSRCEFGGVFSSMCDFAGDQCKTDAHPHFKVRHTASVHATPINMLCYHFVCAGSLRYSRSWVERIVPCRLLRCVDR